jgi:hypothetical protein
MALVVGAVTAPGGSQAAAQSGPFVAVPRVIGQGVQPAYTRLHDAGLRVSIPTPIKTLDFPLYAVRLKPSAGHAVRRGSVVTLTLGCPRCGAGSFGSPVVQPSYRVPNFVGQPVSVAYGWVRQRVLVFDAELAPLDAGEAPTLFANYRVARQSPPPGTMLKWTSGNQLFTPLSISGTQARHQRRAARTARRNHFR